MYNLVCSYIYTPYAIRVASDVPLQLLQLVVIVEVVIVGVVGLRLRQRGSTVFPVVVGWLADSRLCDAS